MDNEDQIIRDLLANSASQCDEAMQDNSATILTRSDLDKFLENCMTEEIRKHQCCKCSKEYIGASYGHHIGECDQCWFDRFPKEQVEEFYRSFFE